MSKSPSDPASLHRSIPQPHEMPGRRAFPDPRRPARAPGRSATEPVRSKTSRTSGTGQLLGVQPVQVGLRKDCRMAGDVPGRWRNRSRNAGHAALLGAGLAGVLTFWRCTRKLAAAETDLDDLAAERKRWQRSVRRNAFETLLAAVFFAGALEIIANIRQLFAAIDRSTKSHSLILRHPHIHWDAGISSADAAVVITAMVLLVATLNVAVASTNLEDARPWSLNQVSRTLWAESLTSVARLAAGVAGGIAISSWWGQGFGPAFVFSWMAVSAVVVTAAIQQRNKDDG